MKNLLLIGAMVLGMNTAMASFEEVPCITYQVAMNASMRLPSHVSEDQLPELLPGWAWITVYRPSRDGSLQESSWASWPDGETLTLCQ
jgi:hypothetical protein